jgi:O-acetyl-ADP-ribose deacetylase (regulator of RNase III)
LNYDYIKCDATQPIGDGKKVIAHCCNDAGGWGSGFVIAISKRWPEPEREYRKLFASSSRLLLGSLHVVFVEQNIWVASIIGQHGYGSRAVLSGPPIRYQALKDGFQSLAQWCIINNATVHMPRIGCGFAGGTWDMVEPLIQDTLCKSGIAVYVYDFK